MTSYTKFVINQTENNSVIGTLLKVYFHKYFFKQPELNKYFINTDKAMYTINNFIQIHVKQ